MKAKHANRIYYGMMTFLGLVFGALVLGTLYLMIVKDPLLVAIIVLTAINTVASIYILGYLTYDMPEQIRRWRNDDK